MGHQRVIDWLNRQIGFVKSNHLENCIMTNNGDLKMIPNCDDMCTLVVYDPDFGALDDPNNPNNPSSSFYIGK